MVDEVVLKNYFLKIMCYVPFVSTHFPIKKNLCKLTHFPCFDNDLKHELKNVF